MADIKYVRKTLIIEYEVPAEGQEFPNKLNEALNLGTPEGMAKAMAKEVEGYLKDTEQNSRLYFLKAIEDGRIDLRHILAYAHNGFTNGFTAPLREMRSMAESLGRMPDRTGN